MRDVQHHVADEETVLLPEAEEMLSKDRLCELGAQMTRRRMELVWPRAAWESTRSASGRNRPVIGPKMPVTIAITAVSAARPPRCSDTAIAIGVVADFGATVRASWGEAPSSSATPTLLTIAVTQPDSSAQLRGNRWRRRRGTWRASGTASATVAGPSRKWTNWAPAK